MLTDQEKRQKFFYSNFYVRYFEAYCYYCDELCQVVPVGLVLGFLIDIIVDRWWSQFRTLPWPDEIAMLLCATVNDDSSDDCLITKEELKEYEASGPINQPPNIIQLTSWAIGIIHNFEASGYIQNSHAVELLILEIQKYR
ncbi:unnamed protein product, partial [Hymenolepis diminuta]|uniref:Bestrophin homolog n=1 Tax=Hymenolepis diminuta TaxID=6216 RepID=A0A158QDF4_HYMDI